MSNHTPKRRLGSIRQKPNGKWLATIERGRKVDGTRRTMSKTFGTKRDAESWLAAQSVALDERPDLGAGVTLETLWAVYKTARQGVLAAKTMAVYAWYMEGAKSGHVGCWLDWMGDVDASAIKPVMVQRRLDAMPREKAHHAKNALSSVLTWAAREGLISENPLSGHRFEYRDPEPESDPFDDDPFAAIEGSRDVWGIETALRCFEMIRGLPLEPAWLVCVGAGLRVEEALALRKMDVRRISVGGHEVTQLAVHAARTDLDRRKTTKTAQSRRIVGMMEPFGTRYWEIVQGIAGKDELVCPMSASNQNKRWRGYFEPPIADQERAKHTPKKDGWNYRGVLRELPYLPLSKMRNTHVTIMAESGVSDSMNALIHGHTEMVERRHYLSPDITRATVRASEHLRLVG